MYEHTIRQFQQLSTRDNLEPHLQIDPFPGFKANYTPYRYQGHCHPTTTPTALTLLRMALLDHSCLVSLLSSPITFLCLNKFTLSLITVILDEKKLGKFLGSIIRQFSEDDLTSYRMFLLHY
ncbi:hypothetical protein Tco_0534227 [Tanacetum coccineum]